jgi:hypothetical protein
VQSSVMCVILCIMSDFFNENKIRAPSATGSIDTSTFKHVSTSSEIWDKGHQVQGGMREI